MKATVEIQNLETVLTQARRLVPPEKMKKIHGKLGKKLLGVNRERIRKQKNLDGSSFTPRKKGKKKILTKILKAKTKQASVIATESGVIVKSNNPVAAKHHFGKTEKFNKSSLPKTANKNDPATDKQVKKLTKDFGLKFKDKNGNKITGLKKNQARAKELFSVKRAGLVIRELAKKEGKPVKNNWTVKLPKRDVLGIRKSDVKLLEIEAKELIIKNSPLGKK